MLSSFSFDVLDTAGLLDLPTARLLAGRFDATMAAAEDVVEWEACIGSWPSWVDEELSNAEVWVSLYTRDPESMLQCDLPAGVLAGLVGGTTETVNLPVKRVHAEWGIGTRGIHALLPFAERVEVTAAWGTSLAFINGVPRPRDDLPEALLERRDVTSGLSVRWANHDVELGGYRVGVFICLVVDAHPEAGPGVPASLNVHCLVSSKEPVDPDRLESALRVRATGFELRNLA